MKVQKCDRDHQKLFYLINAMQEAMRAGAGRDVAHRIVIELRDYSQTHFSMEEALLERTGYQGLDQHRKAHQEFVSRVSGFEEQLAAGTLGISIPMLTFLTRWLSNHILKMDREYTGHLNANHIR